MLQGWLWTKEGSKGSKNPPSHARRVEQKGFRSLDSHQEGMELDLWTQVVQDMKKEAIKHGKQAVSDLGAEVHRRGKEYLTAQSARGKQWLKDQANAASERVRKKVEKHLSDASNKVESVANRVNSAVSKYTGAGSGMPGKTVGAKKGEGWLGDMARRGVRRFAARVYRRGTRR